jgi:hypothetical protein
MILKYGEEIGTKKFEDYKNKQALTNTLEYKKEKYGWTEEQFKEYNASRSVTLENLIRRHGEKIGTEKFKAYVEKQRDAGCSLSYFKQKYGEEEGLQFYLNLNKKKTVTLENYIDRFGEEEGRARFKSSIENNINRTWSNISNELFVKIDNALPREYMYASKTGEYGIKDLEMEKYYYYDFVDKENKKAILFHGDVFHAKSIDQPDFRNPYDKHITAEQQFKHDERKASVIGEYGFKLLVIWESEYRNDKEGTLKKCLEFLNEG